MTASLHISEKPQVSVVVVFHKGKMQTLRCLTSIKDLDYPNYSITVVDDGSMDGSSEAIAKSYPDVKIIVSDGKLWCNGSFNLAIEKLINKGADLFLLLNNDNVIAPDALGHLVETYQSSKRLIVGSLVGYLNKPDTVSYAGKLINWKNAKNILIHNGIYVEDVRNEIIEAHFLGFQGVLISKDVFKTIGFLDDKAFKHYFGDTDFYLRAKEAGFRVIVDTRSVVWDDVTSKGGTGVTTNICSFIKELYNLKSLSHLPTRYRFYRRHAPMIWALPFTKYYLRLLREQFVSMAKYKLRHAEIFRGIVKKAKSNLMLKK